MLLILFLHVVLKRAAPARGIKIILCSQNLLLTL